MDYNFIAFLDKKSPYYPFTKDEFDHLNETCVYGQFQGHLKLRLKNIKDYEKKKKGEKDDKGPKRPRRNTG